MSEQAIERRDQGDALSQVLGTGDTKAMLAQVEQNVKAVIDVARARGFVRRYGDNDQEFYGEPAWSLLGLTYGLVGFVEWTRKIDNGWEARAVARTREGIDVAAAEAMCTRTEGNRRNAPDHTLRAMAQTRARRNALRSALGAALVLAGFDFPDPEAPATDSQVGLLHQLERLLSMTHEEGHQRAGVDSYRQLSREGAHEVIEVWSQALESRSQTRNPHSTPAKEGLWDPASSIDSSGGSRDTAATGPTVGSETGSVPSGSGHGGSSQRKAGDGLTEPAPDGEAGEERPDKRTGGAAAASKASPAGRKRSAAPGGPLSTSDRAAEGPAAGSGRPAAGPQPDHVHDWGPAPSAEMAKRGWRVCSVCRKAIGPGEQE